MKYFRPLFLLSLFLLPLLLVAEWPTALEGSCGVDASVLEPGDILITFDSNIPGWHGGHAALVVDAEKGEILEATCIGSDSVRCSLERWGDYSSFAVLRLQGAGIEERQEIADYAAGRLTGLPYRLTAGIFPRAAEKISKRLEPLGLESLGLESLGLGTGEWGAGGDSVAGTHCSHLIWYAYRHFGYDLDSDGGLIVTPGDLYRSPELERVYGGVKECNY